MKLRFKLLLLIASVYSTGAIAQTSSPAEVDSIFISLIKTVSSTPTPLTDEENEIAAFNLGALDYLSSVYEDSDYYMTGPIGNYSNAKIDANICIKGLPDTLINQFCNPVRGTITSKFGLREDGTRMHKGVDISLCQGDSVMVAFAGTISRVGYERHGYGYFVIVDHPDGVQSRYAHLQRPLTKPGESVQPGKIIGLGGSTGNSTGPHLHFEIRRYGKPVDPTPLLSSFHNIKNNPPTIK